MMTTYRTFVISGPRGATSWKDKLKLGAAMVVGAAVVFAALVVSFSIALVLIPVLGVVYLFRRRILRAFLARAMPPGAQPGAAGFGRNPAYDAGPEAATPFDEPGPFRAPPGATRGGGPTIDADYSVVDPDDRAGKR
jgi:hypothetical protein